MPKIHMGSDATLIAVASIPPRIWAQDKETWKAWLLSLKASAATKQTYKRVIAEFYDAIEKPILECTEDDLATYARVDGLWRATSTATRRMMVLRAYWAFAKQQAESEVSHD